MLGVWKWGSKACEIKWQPGLQLAADGGCERDVVHRMNDWSTEKYAEQ